MLRIRGGNFVAAVTTKILQSRGIPKPDGLVLVYPCLELDVSCWMTPSQLAMIRAESFKEIPSLLQSKDHLGHKSPLSVGPDLKRRKSWIGRHKVSEESLEERIRVKNNTTTKGNFERLSMTSRMTYFNDRIITPDLVG